MEITLTVVLILSNHIDKKSLDISVDCGNYDEMCYIFDQAEIILINNVKDGQMDKLINTITTYIHPHNHTM